MSWLVTLKAKLYAASVVVGLFLIAVARYFFIKHERNKLRDFKKKAEAQIEAIQRGREVDAEIDSEYSDLKREADADIEAGKVPEHLTRDR